MRKRYALQCPKCKKTGLLRLTSSTGGRLSVRCSNCRAILRCLIDRRPHPRRSPIPAIRIATTSAEPVEFTGELTDISETGCRVRAKGLLPQQGQKLNLEIRLPAEFTELNVLGSVVWIRKSADNVCEFGVHFSDLVAGMREAIAGSSIFVSAQDSARSESNAERSSPTGSSRHPILPAGVEPFPDIELAGKILNAHRYKTGTRAWRFTRSPLVQRESAGILNANRYAWRSFKNNLLNADRYSWRNPGSGIINGRKYSWRDTD
ncbi:MAG: PilZ domain-containing protein [Deltaproteobacteria bacterium]|nr:PilZ domain-containing protein [Deltaproteobacteria bacterium]